MTHQTTFYVASANPSRLIWYILLPTIGVVAVLPPSHVLAIMLQKTEDKSEKKLGEKLIRNVTTQINDDVMTSIMQLMTDVARRLEIEFNPGPQTQEIQQQLIAKLDEAIAQAKSQRRKGSPNQKPSTGDRRTKPPSDNKNGESKSSESENSKPGQTSDANAPLGGGVTEAAANGGLLEESRRSWGHLPQRQRDEVIQGAEEKYLQRYREWIERYYRALQEAQP